MEIITAIIYINAFLAINAFAISATALKNATTIEYSNRKDDLLYQWIEGKYLFRKVLRLKLYILVGTSIDYLFEIGGRFYPTVLPYQSNYFAFVALFRHIGLLLFALIFWLVYRKSDFSFLQITKIGKNT